MKIIAACFVSLLLTIACFAPFSAAQIDDHERQNLSKPETSVEFLDQGTFRVTIAFDREHINLDTVNDYDLVGLNLEGCRPEGKPGKPLLPRYYLRVLVPAKSRYKGITPGPMSSVELEGEYSLFPAQFPVPGNHTGPISFTAPDPGLYSRSGAWPEQTVEYISPGIIRGMRYLTFRVTPLKYRPAEKKLRLDTSISFTVTMTEDTGEALHYRGSSPALRRMIGRMAANPVDLDFFYPPPAPAPSTVDYLIITDSELESTFQDFADWKIASGTTAEVVTTDDIYTNYSGGDEQEQIKNCIIDYATTRGTVWVLLGGDDSIVPDRDCYAYVDSADGPVEDGTIPTDLYYAGLDDTDWNDDGDGYPCEPESEGDTIDMDPDVIIARAPVRSISGASVFIAKVMAYTDNEPPAGFEDEMLMLGVHYYNTWDGRSDAEHWNDNIYDNHVDPYWTGTGYRFYDTDSDFGGSSYDVTDSNLIDQINSGYNMILISTHGWYDLYSMESGDYFNVTDVALCTNTDSQGIIYNCSCMTNAFDDATYEPCLSEAFIRQEGGGAVAYIGSSRYSWLPSWATDNIYYSFEYAGEFFRLLHKAKLTAHQYTLGSAFSEHKLALTGSSSTYSCNRWLIFSINLMGDPQMTIRGVEDLVPDTDVGLESYSWDDSTGGDGDLLAERGEEVIITTVLKNDGLAVENVSAELTTSEPKVSISAGSILTDIGFAESEDGEFTFAISDGSAPIDHGLEFTLTISYDDGSGIVTKTETITVRSTRMELYVNRAGGSGTESGTRTDPYLTIQAAIDAAQYAADIYVAEGTYYENIELAENINLYGGYEGTGWARDPDIYTTTINGGNSGSVITLNNLDGTDNLISGFSIREGYANRGGGIFFNNFSGSIMNNTIAGNEAGNNGGGIKCVDSFLRIRNTIIWDNEAGGSGDQLDDSDSGSSITVRYSDVEGGYGIYSSVIDADPEFVDPAFGSWDYHIERSSPCRDAGTGSFAPGDDYDGESRPYGSGIDIGADEWRPALGSKVTAISRRDEYTAPAELIFREIERAREIDPAIMMPDRVRLWIENGGPVSDRTDPTGTANYRYETIFNPAAIEQEIVETNRINTFNPY